MTLSHARLLFVCAGGFRFVGYGPLPWHVLLACPLPASLHLVRVGAHARALSLVSDSSKLAIDRGSLGSARDSRVPSGSSPRPPPVDRSPAKIAIATARRGCWIFSSRARRGASRGAASLVPATMAPPTFPSLYQTGGSTFSGVAFPTAKHVDYGPQSAFGKQPESRSRSLPSFVFGRVDRLEGTRPFFDEAHARDYLQAHEAAGVDKCARPAPGQYGAAELPWKALGRSGRSHAFGTPPGRSSRSRAFGDPPRLRHTDVDRLPGSGANNSTFGPQRVHANVPLKLPKFERVLTREQNNARRYLGREYDARAWIAPDSSHHRHRRDHPERRKTDPEPETQRTLFRVRNHPEIREPGHAREPARRSGRDDASPGRYHETEDFRATRRGRRAGARATYWSRATPAEGTVRQRLYPNSSRGSGTRTRGWRRDIRGTGRNVDRGRDEGRDAGALFFSRTIIRELSTRLLLRHSYSSPPSPLVLFYS